MRRWQLFEIEDLDYCPDWIRASITRMLQVVHRWFGTADIVAAELESMIPAGSSVTIVDLCSGSSGPMPAAVEQLRTRPGYDQVRLVLTDLHPRPDDLAQRFQSSTVESWLRYHPTPVPADQVSEVIEESPILRTMICCFHHFDVPQARQLIKAAQDSGDPLLVFEMTDNRFPTSWFWWIALIPNFCFGLWVALFVRPMTLRHFCFSFLLPIIPACFAWDGAVSNVRTYAREDLKDLVAPIATSEYLWSEKLHPGQLIQHLVIRGTPSSGR